MATKKQPQSSIIPNALPTKDQKPKQNMRYLRDKDREMVRGIFRFHEVPGGVMSFSFKAYKEDPVENFTLRDGDVYTIPLGVAKHLNKNLCYPVHEYIKDESGAAVQRIGRMVRRASFQSLEFVDTDDLSPIGIPETDLVTVENVIHEPQF
jgi:hypothetical protein